MVSNIKSKLQSAEEEYGNVEDKAKGTYNNAIDKTQNELTQAKTT